MSHTGVHINGMGSYKPTMGEVPPETVAARVEVDYRNPDCLKPAYLVQAIRRGFITEDNMHAELVRMPPEKKKAARRRRKLLL